MVNMSKHPNNFKKLFEKYPMTHITADVDSKRPYSDQRSVRAGEIFLDGLDEIASSQEEKVFGPRNEEDRLAALARDRKGSISMLDNNPFPRFNYDLPGELSDHENMEELERLNKLLVDKMYTAYNKDADIMIEDGALSDLARKDNGKLKRLEKNRQKNLKKAKRNYNIAFEVFGEKEDSDDENSKLMESKRNRNNLPDTYYRDMAIIKAKREKSSKKTKRTVKKKPVKKKSDKVVDTLQRRPIPVFAGKPEDLERNYTSEVLDSSDAVEDDQVVFQSAQESEFFAKRNNLLDGVTSIQEQPHKFSMPKEDQKDEGTRHITKDHFDALKDQFYMPGIGNINVM